MTMMQCGHAANALDGNRKPICVICFGLDAGAAIPTNKPDLTGRMSRCSCGKTEPSSEREYLAFFEYRGPGSRTATDICKCGYSHKAHTVEGMAGNVTSNRRTVIEQGKCKGFESRGEHEFDSYYCGHAGWD